MLNVEFVLMSSLLTKSRDSATYALIQYFASIVVSILKWNVPIVKVHLLRWYLLTSTYKPSLENLISNVLISKKGANKSLMVRIFKLQTTLQNTVNFEIKTSVKLFKAIYGSAVIKKLKIMKKLTDINTCVTKNKMTLFARNTNQVNFIFSRRLKSFIKTLTHLKW